MYLLFNGFDSSSTLFFYCSCIAKEVSCKPLPHMQMETQATSLNAVEMHQIQLRLQKLYFSETKKN